MSKPKVLAARTSPSGRTRPAAVLRVLVPAVLVLSMIPDLLLLATKFIPDTSDTAVAGLMFMHVVVTAVGVPAYRWAGPKM